VGLEWEVGGDKPWLGMFATHPHLEVMHGGQLYCIVHRAPLALAGVCSISCVKDERGKNKQT